MDFLNYLLNFFRKEYPFDGSICGETDRWEYVGECLIGLIGISVFLVLFLSYVLSK